MIRLASVLLLFVALPAAACASVDPRRSATLGPPSDSCLDLGADCGNSHDCCSQWCVSGECVQRDP